MNDHESLVGCGPRSQIMAKVLADLGVYPSRPKKKSLRPKQTCQFFNCFIVLFQNNFHGSTTNLESPSKMEYVYPISFVFKG